MKANIINKLILIIALLTAVPTLHAADLEPVTGSVKWVFGSNPTITDASLEKACTIKDSDNQPLTTIPIGNSVEYIIENLKLYRNGNTTNLVKQYEDRLYNYKSLRFVFKVRSATSGTLTLRARKWSDSSGGNDNSGNDKSKNDKIDFTVSVKDPNNNNTLSNNTLSIAKNADNNEGSLNITGLSDGLAIEIYSSTTASYYYILWEPDLSEDQKATPTMSLTADDSSLQIGQTTQLHASFTESISNPQISYSVTSGSDYVSVDNDGVVTALAAGTATVTATFSGNGQYKSASATTNITVTRKPLYMNLGIAYNIDMYVGDVLIVTPELTTDGEETVEVVTGLNTNYLIQDASTRITKNKESGTSCEFTAVNPGVVTLIFGYNGNNTYTNVMKYVTVNILPLTPTIKATGNAELSTLGGSALGLTTAPESVDMNDNVDVYWGVTSVKSNGSLDYQVENLTLTDNTKISSTTETTQGKVDITWRPYTSATPTQLLLDNITETSGSPTYDKSTHVGTYTSGDQSLGWEVNYIASTYAYALVEIEPVSSQINIGADYVDSSDNTSNNFKSFPANTRFLYVPIYGDGRTLKKINVQLTTGGTVTFKRAELIFSNYLPTDASINGIVVNAPNKEDLTLEVNPTSIEIEKDATFSAITYTFKDTSNNTVSGLTPTFTSANTAIATVSNAGVVTGVAVGETTVTVSYPGDETYKSVSTNVTIKVTKKTLVMTISPTSASVEEANTQQFTVTYSYNGTTVTDLTTKYTVSDGKKVSIDGNGLATGIRPTTSAVTVSANFEGNEDYKPLTATATLTVTDNPLFEFMGDELTGDMTGTLKDASNDDLLHWKFGAPENENIYSIQYNKSADKYEFKAQPLKLKSEVHNTENKIDAFNKTKLTDNSGGGDAFTEYNGMMGGFGTEFGGRYLTPISGTFIRVEPVKNGVVTIRLRHNGAVDNSTFTKTDNTYSKIKCARRPLYVMDENGYIMKRSTNYASASESNLAALDGTWARISPTSKVNDRFDPVNEYYTAWFADGSTNADALGNEKDHNFSKNAFAFTRDVIYGDLSDSEFAAVKDGKEQRLFYSDDGTTDSLSNVTYKHELVDETTDFFARYGYECLAATHLKISFPVKAGKTYFVGANKSKVGMCTVEFEETTTTATNVELDEDAKETASWLKDKDNGTLLNVTLKRKFTPGYWHPLVLPFSVSETMLESIFGEGTVVVSLDGSLKMLSSKNNYATRDKALNGGTPSAFNGTVIKAPAIDVEDGSITFTRHYYQMIYANCPVFICPSEVNYDKDGSDEIEGQITFKNVTFQKPWFNDDDELILPYRVDHQISNDESVGYHMVAMYKATDATDNANREMYFVSNSGTTNNYATIYHADKGNAPAMKGTRVWIEPDADAQRTAPLRHIVAKTFYGDDIADDFGTSAIEDIVCDQPLESLVGDDNVYDVAGRVVGYGSTDGLNPGLYIYKGRKIYIR